MFGVFIGSCCGAFCVIICLIRLLLLFSVWCVSGIFEVSPAALVIVVVCSRVVFSVVEVSPHDGYSLKSIN